LHTVPSGKQADIISGRMVNSCVPACCWEQLQNVEAAYVFLTGSYSSPPSGWS
jgi:hypothetical protein